MINKKIALILAYEPQENLIGLISDLKKNDFNVIIVNDGSEKNIDIFNKLPSNIILLTHQKNQGKGAAIKTGLKYIKEHFNSPYFIVTMDCDGQHTVEDAIKLCDEVANNPKELVIGKRLIKSKTPIKSKIGNLLTRFIYKLITRVNVYDTQTGLRAFSDELIDIFDNIKGNRYEYEINVLLKCASHNINIKEVEISTIYFNNNSRISL